MACSSRVLLPDLLLLSESLFLFDYGLVLKKLLPLSAKRFVELSSCAKSRSWTGESGLAFVSSSSFGGDIRCW